MITKFFFSGEEEIFTSLEPFKVSLPLIVYNTQCKEQKQNTHKKRVKYVQLKELHRLFDASLLNCLCLFMSSFKSIPFSVVFFCSAPSLSPVQNVKKCVGKEMYLYLIVGAHKIKIFGVMCDRRRSHRKCMDNCTFETVTQRRKIHK